MLKKLSEDRVFPHDRDTLWIIKKMEEYLGLESKDIDKMNYTELIEYIDKLVLRLLKY